MPKVVLYPWSQAFFLSFNVRSLARSDTALQRSEYLLRFGPGRAPAITRKGYPEGLRSLIEGFRRISKQHLSLINDHQVQVSLWLYFSSPTAATG